LTISHALILAQLLTKMLCGVGDYGMEHFAIVLLVAAATAGMIRCSVADSSTIGMTITSDREPDDFRNPKNTKYELNGGHTFDSGLIFGGSFQFSDTAFGNRSSQNFEGTNGYRLPLAGVFSVTGSVGIGEHWRETPGAAFPYYVLRIGAGLDLIDHFTWDVTATGMHSIPGTITIRLRSPPASHTSSTLTPRFLQRLCAIGKTATRAARASRSDSKRSSDYAFHWLGMTAVGPTRKAPGAILPGEALRPLCCGVPTAPAARWANYLRAGVA
jgi:hypothetical protein